MVRRERRELPRARVDGLVDGADAEAIADAADLSLADAAQLRELRVGEAVLLREAEGRRVELRGILHEVGDLVDEGHLVEEPRVDLRRLERLLDGRAEAHRLLQHDDPSVSGLLRDLEQLVFRAGLVAPVEARPALLERAERLLQGRRVVAADRHRLADRFHGRREGRIGVRELLEVEPGHLDDDVVEGRLEARGRRLRDVVGNLVEPVADRELRGELRDRKAGRLRGERRRARDARVHLDDDDAAGLRIDGELDVAAARVDADGADDVDADVAKLLVLAVGEGERGGDRDRVARVHADGVDVLDRADDDRVVGGVAHELELVLLPPEDRLLEQHLGRRRVAQARTADAAEVFFVVREARAETAHRERGAHDEGVAQLGRAREQVVHGVSDHRTGDVRPGIEHQLLEDLTVFALADRVDLRADQLDAVALEDPLLVQGHRGVEGRLAAEGRQDGIRLLFRDDRLDHGGRDRLDVGRVGEVGVGHDRRRVGVDENDAHALFAEHAARLGAGVVELAGLADDDRAGADDEDARDVVALGHYLLASRVERTRSAKRSKR